MEESVHQRGAVVEVLGHVVQPVGLHPFDPVVAVLDLQWNLDRVVLDGSGPARRVVVEGQQLRPCGDEGSISERLTAAGRRAGAPPQEVMQQ